MALVMYRLLPSSARMPFLDRAQRVAVQQCLDQ
jgi:hypothetical protein